jgi:VanZ family protein
MNRKIRFMILLTYLILITAMSLLPSGALHIPDPGLFPHADKVVHFGMYSVLTFLVFYTWPEKFQARYRQLIPLLVVIMWGSAMEILQGLGGYGRHFSHFDILANILGFFPGWIAWRWFFNKKYGETIPVHPD